MKMFDFIRELINVFALQVLQLFKPLQSLRVISRVILRKNLANLKTLLSHNSSRLFLAVLQDIQLMNRISLVLLPINSLVLHEKMF